MEQPKPTFGVNRVNRVNRVNGVNGVIMVNGLGMCLRQIREMMLDRVPTG